MLGSVHDAEDALQEALLRAWRGLPRFEGRSSLRSWLYRIATNVCLDAIARRPEARAARSTTARRPIPHDGAGDAARRVGLDRALPRRDARVEDGRAAPEARYEQRESVELAFVAALQHLPAHAARGADPARGARLLGRARSREALDTSVAVGQQRAAARAPDRRRAPARAQPAGDAARARRRARCASSSRATSTRWERGDVDAVVALLTEDATWSMPPMPAWYRGREAVSAFLAEYPLRERWRHVPTRANGQLAVGCYIWQDERGSYVAAVLDVLDPDGARIGAVTGFVTPWVSDRFGATADFMTARRVRALRPPGRAARVGRR